MHHIIAYDITDQRRLQKIHRLLANSAIPLQNSTFLFIGSNNALASCLKTLIPLLHPQQDDLRIYPLKGRLYSLGKTALPPDIVLADFPEYALQSIDNKDKF